ncbi:hypothetical protein [Altererythrobacter sp. ZODW24]|uniref:hypothetical protein n=1 Tax=Altererythrobacter sp. ZODW24 TaxID=2185142 RepID=UPI0013B3FE1B|nr:hypothetical protein [Altererythrobacter sp. ZODW24]
MIDYATLALTHGLLALAVIRLMVRGDLDSEGETKRPSRRSAHKRPSEQTDS